MDATHEVELKRSPLESHAVLAILLVSFVLFPLAGDDTALGTALIRIFFQVVLIGTLLAVARNRWVLLLGLGLVTASTVLRLTPIAPLPERHVWANALALAFMGVLVLASAQRLLLARRVEPELISGAVSLYLILGFAWFLAYDILEAVAPGSFTISDSAAQGTTHALFYFSFVTLTTLGYGDISPLSDLARSLAILEAIVGQVFLIVMVSGLVSLHFASRRRA